MTDKTKSQTYNFLLENKTIEDIKKQENIEVKEIKNKRHGGKTYRIDNANNRLINDNLSENEIFYDTYDTVVDWNNIYTEEISKLQTTIQEQTKEIQQLKKQICMQSLKLKNRNRG